MVWMKRNNRTSEVNRGKIKHEEILLNIGKDRYLFEKLN
jgi:hypothetical protein